MITTDDILHWEFIVMFDFEEAVRIFNTPLTYLHNPTIDTTNNLTKYINRFTRSNTFNIN